jgi:flagellar biosynthesis/type III secretory pathway ATPase
MNRVATPAHREAAASLRALLATYEAKSDLVSLGAYRPGTDEAVDRAVRARQDLRDFLRQPEEEAVSFESTTQVLASLHVRHRARAGVSAAVSLADDVGT